MIVTTDVGLFGPYSRVEEMADRLRVWPVGAGPNAPGADLPFAVVGSHQTLDVALPDDFDPANYAWNGTALVPKTEG